MYVKSLAGHLDHQKVVSLTLDSSGNPWGILLKTQQGLRLCISLIPMSHLVCTHSQSAQEFQILLMGVDQKEVLPPRESNKNRSGCDLVRISFQEVPAGYCSAAKPGAQWVYLRVQS